MVSEFGENDQIQKTVKRNLCVIDLDEDDSNGESNEANNDEDFAKECEENDSTSYSASFAESISLSESIQQKNMIDTVYNKVNQSFINARF